MDGDTKLLLLISMDEVQKRVNRLVGQLRGIQKMIEEDRDAIEIVQQISAVKKALNGLTWEVLSKKIAEDFPEAGQKKLNELLKRAIDL